MGEEKLNKIIEELKMTDDATYAYSLLRGLRNMELNYIGSKLYLPISGRKKEDKIRIIVNYSVTSLKREKIIQGSNSKKEFHGVAL